MKNSNAKIRFLEIKKMLQPFCRKVEAVGDLRRKCKQVNVIELLAISRVEEIFPLFGSGSAQYQMIEDWVSTCGLKFSINTYLYKRFFWKDSWVNLYLTNPYQWGLQLALRTGCEDYIQWLMTKKEKGGALPNTMRIGDGWLWANDKKIITITEQNFYTSIETEWIRPEQRNNGDWRQ